MLFSFQPPPIEERRGSRGKEKRKGGAPEEVRRRRRRSGSCRGEGRHRRSPLRRAGAHDRLHRRSGSSCTAPSPLRRLTSAPSPFALEPDGEPSPPLRPSCACLALSHATLGPSAHHACRRHHGATSRHGVHAHTPRPTHACAHTGREPSARTHAHTHLPKAMPSALSTTTPPCKTPDRAFARARSPVPRRREPHTARVASPS